VHRLFSALVIILPMAAIPAGGAADSEPLEPLLDGLGDHHHPVTTESELAQRYFDQGLILAFAFNHGEAHRSFMQAAALDPDCAMAWWGAAWVLGPNLNAAMDPERAPDAWTLLNKAEAAAERATPREQAYVAALGERYGPEALEDRSPRDQAFARAMGEVAARYPDDLDAQVIYVEALMDTMPWDYWRDDDESKEATQRVLQTLDAVLRRAPDHPMANHLMIHAVEKVHPAQGLEEAKRLEDLVPGAGHLVHMPAHIYIRVGRYHDATLANQRAIAADRRYLEQVDARGVYRLAYMPHNFHFGWSTASFEGRSELALRLAREMAGMIDAQAMRQRPLTTLQHYWITPVYGLVRFGKWDAVLAREEPAEDLIYPRAAWYYARGLAHARQGRVDAAREALEQLDRLRADPSLKWVTVWDINKSRNILEIASLLLTGEIAAVAGDFDTAIASMERAAEREDALTYDEPPTWHYPVRQSLGAVLLMAGRPARAEAVYREDLATFPDNGWSLFGLLQALRAQGESAEAEDVQRRFREAWRHADVVLTASRF